MIDVKILRAAGLSDTQIVAVVEALNAERIARRREQNRIAKKNQRSRHQSGADCQQNRADVADIADLPPPPSSPSLNNPPPLTPTTLFPLEPNGSNGAAPSRAELEKQLFARGKQVLGKSAGGMVATLFKSREYDIVLTGAVIEAAAGKQDPREYVAAAIKGGNGNGQVSRHNGFHRETLDERCQRLAAEARRLERAAGIGGADDPFGSDRRNS